MSLLQGLDTRVVQPWPGQIAQAMQRMRGRVGADEPTIAVEGGNRCIDVLNKPLQPLRKRHGTADGIGHGDEDALAAVAEAEPAAAAGDKRTERRSEAAQPPQPECARCRQPVGKLRHLPPVRIGWSEDFPGECCAVGGSEQPGADRIRPEDASAVDRPQPCRQPACCIYRQPLIADASQLEFRMVHRTEWPAGFGPVGIGSQTMTALMEH